MTKRTLWNKIGRFITGATVLCFFLPFFGISCDGFDVVTVSGTDMVIGAKPGGAAANARGSEGTTVQVENVPIEPLAIAALALALIGFALAWLRTRQALLGSSIVAIAGLGVLIGLYIKVNGDLKDSIAAQREKSKRTGVVEAGGRMGLWLTGLGLLGTAALSGMALAEREPRRTG